VRASWLGLLLLLPLTGVPAAELRDLHVLEGPDGTRVVFDLDQASAPKIFTLGNPDRVVVDFAEARWNKDLHLESAAKGFIKAVRTGPRDKGLRVVLETAAAVTPHQFDLGPGGGYGYRLILDLPGSQPVAVPKAGVNPARDLAPGQIVAESAASSPTSTPAPVAVAAAPVAEKAAEKIEKTNAERAVTTERVADKAPTPERAVVSEKAIVVAVDAGHGGDDPGAQGANGLQEKDVTLAIARKLAQRINAQPGMRAVLTRDGDYFVELRDRTVRARKAQADLFVSIHANAYKDRDMRGTAVYVLSDRGATSEQARWIANHENAADLVGGVKLQNKDDDLAAVLIDISQSATMEASFDLGGRLLDSLGKINTLQKAQVQQAGFMVLKSPDIPSVLVETAFISNPREEALLRDESYRDKLATSIFEGVRSYFARYRPLQQVASAQTTPPSSDGDAGPRHTSRGRNVRVSLSRSGTD